MTCPLHNTLWILSIGFVYSLWWRPTKAKTGKFVTFYEARSYEMEAISEELVCVGILLLFLGVYWAPAVTLQFWWNRFEVCCYYLFNASFCCSPVVGFRGIFTQPRRVQTNKRENKIYKVTQGYPIPRCWWIYSARDLVFGASSQKVIGVPVLTFYVSLPPDRSGKFQLCYKIDIYI